MGSSHVSLRGRRRTHLRKRTFTPVHDPEAFVREMNRHVERLMQDLINGYSVQMGVSLRPESLTSHTNAILSVLEAGFGNSFRTDVDES